MIGLFDSGLGGLTVVRRVRALLPAHDLLFFADQAHVPYGERDEDDLRRLLQVNLSWLDAQGVDAIAMACNTTCAVAALGGWPPCEAVVLDLIESAAIALSDAEFLRIGVLATSATVRSGAYGETIRRRVAGAQVFEVAAPALVPIVEAGQADGERARAAVAEACAQLPERLDAVVLACTHYPLLDAHFAAVLGPEVARVDPAFEQAGRTAALVAARSFPAGSGRTRCVTNGPDVAAFRRVVTEVLGEASVEVIGVSAVT